MDNQMSLGEQAYELFCKIPKGLILPEVYLLKVTTAINIELKAQSLPLIKLWSPAELKELPDMAAKVAIELIPTLKQLPIPTTSDIAKLL